MRDALAFLLVVGAAAWALAAFLGRLADSAWEDAATWKQVPVAECLAAGIPMDQCSEEALAPAPSSRGPWWVKYPRPRR